VNVAVLPAALRLHTPAELVASFAALTAPTTFAWDAPPDPPRVEGLPNDQSQQSVTPAYLDSVADDARMLARHLTLASPYDSAACTPETPAACSDKVLLPLGRLIWRRPLEPDEQAWLVRSVKALPAAVGSKDRVAAAVRMLALAPQALFRFEGAASTNASGLDDFQRADLIAYGLTGAPPDAELARSAQAGALRSPATLREQIKRVAALPAARGRLTRFLQDVLHIDDPETLKKDGKLFPDFTSSAIKTLRGSFDAFSGDVWTGTGDTWKALLTAPTFKDVTGKRAGVFTHPAFLATHADETASRPIHRARAVVERLLCVHLPDPPPDAAAAKPPTDPGLSPRQRFDKMTAAPQCAACHTMLNPVGFSLDGYDAIGKPRTTLAGMPIDTSGVLDLDGKRVTYDAPPALMNALAGSATARECMVTRAWRHVAGRQELAGDSCFKSRVLAQLQATGNLRDAVVELAALQAEARRAGS
jgi:hypothetical protein